MKQYFVQMVTVIFIVSMFTSPALAQLKVGVVDFQKVIELSQTGAKATATFKVMVDKWQRELKAKKDKVSSLREDLLIQAQSNLLKPSALREKETELNDKMLDFQRSQEDVQKQYRREEGKLMEKMTIEIKKVINELGKKESFDLILEKSQSALYNSDKIDITDEVIKMVDAVNN